jgi:response regulator RpfG family c-di-GMP phosphodiesterase
MEKKVIGNVNKGRKTGEQLEIPGVGLSKENREKVNTRIGIVGDENSSLEKLIRDQGYQVRVFQNGSLVEEEISKEEFNCDLIITDYPSEVSFFIDEVRELPDHLNFPIIVLAQEKELKKYEGFFESTKGVICMKYSKGAVLSKIQELIKKLKQERK